MPLQSVPEMMRAAQAGRYAVGYFESWNIESLQGVLDAAEQMRAPIIIGINGDFLSRDDRLAPERLEVHGAMLRSAAQRASLPCGVIFNECPNDDWVERAIVSGCFNLVMPADPAAAADDYLGRVRRIVAIAHDRGVAVEAELGELPCSTGGHETSGSLTDADQAARFVENTGVDLLAVSVGNVHVRLSGQGALDLDRLRAIRRSVSCPLVLHGGTGIDQASLRAAIEMGGVAKVNFGTYLKQRYLHAVRKALASQTQNPHELLGIGGRNDVMTAGRIAVRDAVLERIGMLGCCGKAGEP